MSQFIDEEDLQSASELSLDQYYLSKSVADQFKPLDAINNTTFEEERGFYHF
jgi:hypothetical protein